MNIKSTKLSNDIQLVTCKKPSRTVYAGVFINDHKGLEEVYGTRHFLEHVIALGGSKKYPSKTLLQKTFRNLGTLDYAWSNEDHLVYEIISREEHYKKSLEILLELLTNPLFDKNYIKSEKRVIKEEMENIEDDLIFLSGFTGDQTLWESGTLYYHNFHDDINDLRKINQKILQDYYFKHYTTDKIIIGVSGNVIHQEIAELVEKATSNLPKRSHINIETQENVTLNKNLTTFYNKKSKACISVLAKGPEINSNDDPFFRVLDCLLSGELYLMREKIPAYYSGTVAKFRKVNGCFIVRIITNPENLIAGTTKILGLLETVKTKIDQEMLMGAKQEMATRLGLRQEDNTCTTAELCYQALAGKKIVPFEQKIQDVLSVDSKGITDFTKRLFAKENVRVNVIGPFGTKEQEEVEKLYDQILT